MPRLNKVDKMREEQTKIMLELADTSNRAFATMQNAQPFFGNLPQSPKFDRERCCELTSRATDMLVHVKDLSLLDAIKVLSILRAQIGVNGPY